MQAVFRKVKYMKNRVKKVLFIAFITACMVMGCGTTVDLSKCIRRRASDPGSGRLYQHIAAGI